MTDNIPTARSEALILDRDGPPTFGLEAARVLAKIIRGNRDQTGAGSPEAGVDEPATRRTVEGH
ncbi:MAG: hypothetical protein NVS3B26_23820 [Mycobacteriales bacterium]